MLSGLIHFLILAHATTFGYRVLISGKSGNSTPVGAYFKPFATGFVGFYGDPANYLRERINEGAFETPSQELLFEGPMPRQVCPGMVGPFSDGSYYCTAREYGYCDKRSGTCFCNIGYQGLDCSECSPTHFMVGNLCYPKKWCENDCNGAGSCNFMNGTCSCLPHRQGPTCETQLCTIFSPLCSSCTATECLMCAGGYYLTLESGDACSSCYDFDPRCQGCTKELGCTTCADPVLTSVHRSGYRSANNLDPRLPIEEDTREFGITLPFGTKSPEAFADAEEFFVCTTPSKPLNSRTQECIQGLNLDESWKCSPVVASHKVCGHYGVFRFSYPNYVVSETDKTIHMTVLRSGGGYGNVTIGYNIKHFTTNDSDVIATARYTTLQTLSFGDGVVSRTFSITILDDAIVEENEVFQVLLEVPQGGGSVGAQFRANVTIIDDDLLKVAAKLTKPLQRLVSSKAGSDFSVQVQATLANGQNMTIGGEKFFSVIENYQNQWADPGTPSRSQRHSLRKVCSVTDNDDGTYSIGANIQEQGNYQLRTWHCFPRGLKGQYYKDAFFQTLAVERLDPVVNFTWGTGRLIPRGTDYISIRWSGAIQPDFDDTYYFYVDADDHARLWVDGDLVLDRFHAMASYLEPSRPVALQGGKLYEIILEYREVNGEAHARLMWNSSQWSMQVITENYLFALYEIGLSPVNVTVLSSETDATTTECTGDGLYNGVALQRSYFQFCPRDQYGNMRDDDNLIYLSTALFNAQLNLVDDLGHNGLGSTVLTPMLSFDRATHCFNAHYTPERAGLYRLDVWYQTWHGEQIQPVAGSPFMVTVIPTKTSGPYSQVFGLPSPLYLTAGNCAQFTIVMRDVSHNLRLQGGDDIEVYMYQVDRYFMTAGALQPASKYPRPVVSYPTSAPPPTAPAPFAPLKDGFPSSIMFSSRPDTAQAIVRDGIVFDLGNGNYTAKLCPVIAGWYEIHALLNGKGVSNQPVNVIGYQRSLGYKGFGTNTHLGQYIASSPYSLMVNHAMATGHTSSADGQGLRTSTVGIPTNFIVTLRDPWDNVIRTRGSTANVSVTLPQSPSATVVVWDYKNGSFNVDYVPILAGQNLLVVKVNGVQIPGSPFTPLVTDGMTNVTYSYAQGPGLQVGTAGVAQYFEVFSYDFQGNRKSTSNDVYVFSVHGSNNITGSLSLCPFPGVPDHPVCSPTDTYPSHYWGSFTPLKTGLIVVEVSLVNGGVQKQVSNSPFPLRVFPGGVDARSTNVTGTIYDNVAGVNAFVGIQLRDTWGNKLEVGGNFLELALLGVGVEWGTIQPWDSTPGLPNAHHYKGFYAGYPNYYGIWVDDEDSTYTAQYNIPLAGQYVMRISVAESGLNATYFNDTTFGTLFDGNFNYPGFVESRGWLPTAFDTSISWTGDIGVATRFYGAFGNSTYYQKFQSRRESNINFNLSMQATQINIDNLTETAFPHLPHTPQQRGFPNKLNNKFREEYWSVRWTGMITPQFAERYNFSVVMDSTSVVHLYIGGVGTALNGSQPGALVINTTLGFQGLYTFSDSNSREFVLEYSHADGPSHLALYWESATTKRSIVPAWAFTHWRNISHYNLTIHPAPLCSSCSTAYGRALSQAQVAVKQSFVVYGRDRFGNLLQTGGDLPSMVAIGRDGVAFRGDVTDYGNSTYLIEYYVTVAGKYRMYVTIGCCPPHPNVGLPAEIDMMRDILIQGTPFSLTVASAPVTPSRSVAVGQGLLGGVVGQIFSFVVLFRDIHNNPTTIDTTDDVAVMVNFFDQSSSMRVDVKYWTQVSLKNVTVTYNATRAGNYYMFVTMAPSDSIATAQPILASPFAVIMSPAKVYPLNTVCRGVGLKNASVAYASPFEVRLFDVFNNAVQVGGAKLFTRLVGDARFGATNTPVVPLCTDARNGQYSCTYTPLNRGYHHLVIKVLNSSFSRPGGNGLLGSYFSTAAVGPGDEPVAVRLDPQLDFNWPNGFVSPVPLVASTIEYPQYPSLTTGQAIQWNGFLVSPRSDEYTFAVWARHLNASVYLDSALVFDSAQQITQPATLTQFASYEIRVEAVVSPQAFNAPTALHTIFCD